MLKDYKSNLKKLFNDLDKSKKIIIDDKEYKELVNVSYEVVYNRDNKNVSPETLDDQLERGYLMGRLKECIELIKNDIHTRRGVYSNLYPNILGKCISLVQVFVRNNKIFINLYYRSQNGLRNFWYDNQTANLLMSNLVSELKLKPGKITAFVMSFHKLIEDDILLREIYAQQ